MKKNYKILGRVFALLIAFAGLSLTTHAQNAWINEIHYDNAGTDVNELIEVVVEDAGSYDLSLFSVVLYNGNGGAVYNTRLLSTFTAGATSGNFSIYYFIYPVDGIQNGSPDGIALAYGATLIQFLSYEGTLTAVGGVANGVLSTDIGVMEPTTSPVGNSLQLAGNGAFYTDFTWQAPATATAGTLNNGQTLVTGGINNPSNFTTVAVSTTQIDLSWTNNANSDSVLIAYNTVNTFGTPTDVYTVGDAVTGGGTILYKGTGTSTNHTGLPDNTEYFYTAWSFTNTHEYSSGVLDSATTLKPEPSSYPADFLTTATGITITCDWTDAIGDQLPDAYLILISDQDNIATPVDGTPVPDDRDVTDGNGAMNVAFGLETFTFFRLEETTNYYLKIFPYTNSGIFIDYLTVSTPAAVHDTTQSIIAVKDFEDNLWGDWTTFNVTSDKVWQNLTTGGGAYATSRYASMSGYYAVNGVLSNDWLISPPLNLNMFTEDKMIFFNSWNFGTNTDELTVKYSTDYIGGDPTLATWTELTYTKATTSLTWVPSGFIDLSSIDGNAVYVAFQYLSQSFDLAARTWRVDEVEITGSTVGNPSNFVATTASSSQIDLTWNLNLESDSVIIAFNSTNTFGTPTGIYSINDGITGGGTVIYKGTGTSFNHTGLTSFTNYYYRAWSMSEDHSYSTGVDDNALTYKVEPSEYPANFASAAANITITATWTDAAGVQLPDGYLLMISNLDNITAPVDGIPAADDLDLSDGSGAINIGYGPGTYTFYHLNGDTEYFLKIYPYTNSGPGIDYKTDDPAPSSSAVTEPVINQVGFNDNTFGTWTTYSVASNKNWVVYTFGGALNTSYSAEANGYGQDVLSNDWLISPSFDLDMYENENMVFYSQWKYGSVDTELKLLYSTNYIAGDPTLATWTELAFTRPAVQDIWTFSGIIDLTIITGSNIHLAFQYLSTNDPRRWRVDEIVISGVELDVVLNPTNFEAVAVSANEIDLSWVKNINNDNVVVAWNSTNTFGVPEGFLSEGAEIPGGGTVIYNGAELTFIHGGLEPETPYYYKAWSVDAAERYSSGATAEATTFFGEPEFHPTGFQAVANGYSQITVSWTDSDADHYLVKGSSISYADIISPVDFVQENNSTLVKNIDAAVQSAVFTGLMPTTTYYFKIFPYNGTGIVTNYKTDGAIPEASAITTALDMDLIISEVADPSDVPNAKFVELMNTGTTTIDFTSTPVYLSRQANGGSWTSLQLTGSVGPGETYVISYVSLTFLESYGFNADLNSSAVSGNGDDGYFLYFGGPQGTGTLLDAYGVIGQDGSGYPWDYLDKKAVRKRSITAPNSTWTASEWVIPSTLTPIKDMTPDFHQGTVTWLGTTSTNWNEKALNWNSPFGFIPDASCNVIIPFTDIINFPIVTEACAVHEVQIESGASLSIQGTGSLLIVGP